MELRDLEYFAVLAEHGNMSRASEALGLSAPALSKSLQRLESSIRARLFERTPKGVTLTPVGGALLARLGPLRLALADVVREAEDLSRGRVGHLRIGVNPVDAEYLPEAYAALLSDSPDLTIGITVSDLDVTLPQLRRGELDLVIVVAPESPLPDLAQEPLYDDEYVVTASARHRLAGRKSVRLRDLVPERWTLSEPTVRPTQILRRAFEAEGLPAPRIAVQTRSVRVKLLTNARSNLLGFGSRQTLSAAGATFRLAVLPVKELTLPRPVCVLYRKRSYLSPAARRLIESLKLLGSRLRARGQVNSSQKAVGPK